MTWRHVSALMIAALLFLVCEFSGKCSDKMVEHASQISMAIVVGVIGNAMNQAEKGSKPKKGSDAK